MPSTFFGLTIASSGLSAYQIALNTTANNISNVQTDGYSKQQTNRVASDALRVYQKYGAVGTGVTTTSITQLRNQYYDTKYWYNQSSVGLYETKLNYMQQIENYYIDDDSAKGFSTILNTMFNALDTLKNQSGDTNARQQFIGSAQNFATFFNATYQGLSEIQNNANEEIKSTVANINSIAEKIANLNKQINVIEVQGGYANELRDQRALLIDELSEIVPTEVSEVPVKNSNYPEMETGANYYTVKIGGQILVDTYDYDTLTCVARENRVNQSDNDGLYDLQWKRTGNNFAAGASSMSGTLKALFDIRDGNNGENFTGVANVLNSKQVQVVSPSITAVEAMTMPESGVLTINGNTYNYTDFEFELDADGNVTSYTFNLENALSVEQRLKVDGMKASIGSSVNQMGIPYYMSQMNQFLRSFASKFNDIMLGGEDLNGDKTNYYSFFTGTDLNGDDYFFDGSTAFNGSTVSCTSSSYYKLTAANICASSLCVKEPDKLATQSYRTEESGVDDYNLIEELAKLKSDTVLFRGGSADGFLKCMISDVSIDAQKAKIFEQNFTNIQSQLETQRMSVSGVDEDEEALDLIKFQNAYNLSSKMISVMAEVYDKLIEETGV
jgi:flagellar hook-associated protein 1 FlgK